MSVKISTGKKGVKMKRKKKKKIQIEISKLEIKGYNTQTYIIDMSNMNYIIGPSMSAGR